MKTISQLKQEIADREAKIKELEETEKLKNFQEVTYKGKKFRIYKWENKPYSEIINKDFTCKFDKKLRLAEFQEFNELIENKLFKMKVWKSYITKHFNKLQWNKKYCLSRCCLGGDSVLYSGYSDLSGSIDDGRVVFVEVKK